MTWTQNYIPFGDVGPSAPAAALPIVVLPGLLGFLHLRAHVAVLAALVGLLMLLQAHLLTWLIPR